jgi:outer membrane protein assembly factor BamD
MRRHSFLYGALISGLCVSGCHHPADLQDRPLAELSARAHKAMADKSFERAADVFDSLESQYPYADQASKAKLWSAYCAFQASQFSRAIATLDVFISVHPSSYAISYAYYLRALCYYASVLSVARDRENAELALQAFEEYVHRFPGTKYQADVAQKLQKLRDHLASQDLLVARQYIEESVYISALEHLNAMVVRWGQSPFMPEILYRIGECQKALGLTEGLKKTVLLLTRSYAKSPWCTLAQQWAGPGVARGASAIKAAKR